MPDPQPNPQVDKQQAWRALIALCVGLFMTLLDQSLVAVALPRIREDLDASLNQVVWVSAVYLLAFAVPLLVTGRLGDRFGQRSVYLVGMALFTAAALACAFAPTIEWLIALRAVQGLGGSLLNPQPLSIITRIFPRARRGTAMGVWSAVASSAGLFGPVIGGVLVGTVGWRWVFAFYVPLGLVSLVLVARFVPRLPRSVGHIDLLSVVVSLIAVLGVVVALTAVCFVAAALVLTSPYTPLLVMGEETASNEPTRLHRCYQSLISLRREREELSNPWLTDLAIDYDDDIRWIVVHRGSLRVSCNLSDQALTVPAGGTPLLWWDDPTSDETAAAITIPAQSFVITESQT